MIEHKIAVAKLCEYFRSCFPIEIGSNVILTVDQETDKSVVDLLVDAIHTTENEVKVLECSSPAEFYMGTPTEYPDTVNSFSHWIDLARQGACYSETSKQYVRRGGHFLVMSGISQQGLEDGVFKQNTRRVLDFTHSILSLFIKTHHLHITSEAGTDIHVSIGKIKLELKDIANQLLEGKGIQKMFYGQVIIPIQCDTMNGRLVIKDYIWPLKDPRVRKEPVILQIKDGRIDRFEKNNSSISLLDWLNTFNDMRLLEVSHLTYGTLAGVSFSDSILMNERMLGALTFGCGNIWTEGSPAHVDMVCCDTSIDLDGKIFQDRGEIVNKSGFNTYAF